MDESPAFCEIAGLLEDDEPVLDYVDSEGRRFLKNYPLSRLRKLVNVCLILDMAREDMCRTDEEAGKDDPGHGWNGMARQFDALA